MGVFVVSTPKIQQEVTKDVEISMNRIVPCTVYIPVMGKVMQVYQIEI